MKSRDFKRCRSPQSSIVIVRRFKWSRVANSLPNYGYDCSEFCDWANLLPILRSESKSSWGSTLRPVHRLWYLMLLSAADPTNRMKWA